MCPVLPGAVIDNGEEFVHFLLYVLYHLLSETLVQP